MNHTHYAFPAEYHAPSEALEFWKSELRKFRSLLHYNFGSPFRHLGDWKRFQKMLREDVFDLLAAIETFRDEKGMEDMDQLIHTYFKYRKQPT